MKIVITAGGTREYIDPVRYITNASTGKMGYALAKAAIDAQMEVTLISAPTVIERPDVHKFISVETSEQMYRAVRESLDGCDCLIMAAAVSDYAPCQSSNIKLKKKQQKLTIELKPTIDILSWAGKNKTNQYLVGFALEDRNLLINAQEKLINKNLDMIIANSPDAISADYSSVHIKTKHQDWKKYHNISKEKSASIIISQLQSYINNV